MSNEIMEMKIEKAIRKAPMLSPGTVKLLQLAGQEDPDMQAIIRIVKHDTALTARLLKVVNSAAFGLLKPASTVDRAVTYLGLRMVVSTAISNNVGDLFNKQLDGYESSGGSLWDHNLFCAIAANALAPHAKTPLAADLAFTAGLLHDIGKAVISEILKGTTQAILEGIAAGTIADYLEAEKAQVGMDHAQVGQMLARHWKLPDELHPPILHHHRPLRAEPEARALTFAVHLGDTLAMMAGVGTGSDSLQYQLNPGYTECFDISENDLACILLNTTEEFQKIKASLENS